MSEGGFRRLYRHGGGGDGTGLGAVPLYYIKEKGMEHPLWAVFGAWRFGVDGFRQLVFSVVRQIKTSEKWKKSA